LAFLLAVSSSARDRAVQHPLTPRSVLWIAAHPDDELLVAPLLSRWCRDEGARCTFLILTRGEAGICRLANGCTPDIASVRAAEAASASQLFHANLILLTLPDGGGASPPAWPDDLPITIAKYIEAVHPDLILTFDPRHGTTGHPDHRATGAAVVEAVDDCTLVWLLETLVDTSPSLRFRPATNAAIRFEGSWSAIIEDMQRHPSQFDARWIAAVQGVPESDRAVYIAPACER
jgi:LmbE family N-acetylglucosaminyl deacetylase